MFQFPEIQYLPLNNSLLCNSVASVMASSTRTAVFTKLPDLAEAAGTECISAVARYKGQQWITGKGFVLATEFFRINALLPTHKKYQFGAESSSVTSYMCIEELKLIPLIVGKKKGLHPNIFKYVSGTDVTDKKFTKKRFLNEFKTGSLFEILFGKLRGKFIYGSSFSTNGVGINFLVINKEKKKFLLKGGFSMNAVPKISSYEHFDSTYRVIGMDLGERYTVAATMMSCTDDPDPTTPIHSRISNTISQLKVKRNMLNKPQRDFQR